MKTAARRRIWLFPVLLILLGLAIALFFFLRKELDPHKGQVYIYDGFDWIWYTPLEGVEANPWTAEDFIFIGRKPVYLHDDYETRVGIDVSEHQHEIDWTQISPDDLDYAYIRIGRRGYTEGGLFEDPYYRRNVQGARAAGLDVGVYFFSQAISVGEAIEEARFVLELLDGQTLDLPVVFDWEKVASEDARTKELSSEIRTECAVAFCETIKSAGYEPAVYFNRNIGYYGYDLSRLTDYAFWFALPEAGYPSFYYAVDSWQYSFAERIPGIETETDMNMMFIPVPEETETADA